MLNKQQFLELSRIEPKKLAPEERAQNFVEIQATFDMEAAQAQADRCLHCASPYCQWACPVHNYIPNWLKLVAEGNIMEAVEMSHKTNSLPEICGTLCPQDRLCEGACTLEDTGFKAVTIGAIERFILEQALSIGWEPKIDNIQKVDKKVAVIGAGPAGLSCTDILLRNGVSVDIFESNAEAGGLITFGIPEFKLEKSVIIRRRKMLEKMGAKFHFNCTIGKTIAFEELHKKYDCIFIGIGTYKATQGNFPGEDSINVKSALPFLIDNINFRHNYGIYANQQKDAPIDNVTGQRVVVLGGGDTAMDCSRTAIRQGAKSVACIYRRDRENMPGSPKEVAHAIEEGVQFCFNQSPLRILNDENNQVIGVEVAQTELGDIDENGRCYPQIIEGSQKIIDSDVVLISFGFQADPPAWLKVKLKANKTIDCSANQTYHFQTSDPKVFAGGDMVLGSGLVVQAVNEGRQAAEGILDYLEV